MERAILIVAASIAKIDCFLSKYHRSLKNNSIIAFISYSFKYCMTVRFSSTEYLLKSSLNAIKFILSVLTFGLKM